MSIQSKKAVSPIFKGFLFVIGVLIMSTIIGGEHAFAASNSSIDSSTPGFFNHYIVYPFSVVLKTVASWFQGNYGLSIVFVTLMLRLVLMPIMLKQSKSQMILKDKMANIQPEMKVIQEKLKKTTSAEEKAKLQQELMLVYKKHNMNPLASLGGCLPVLLQMPILMGFYYAIRSTPEMATHSFLWFDLGQPDIFLAVLAAVVYLLQFKISLTGLPEEQKKQMAIVGYLSPFMMGFFSLTAPAALPLYWVVGGCFLMVQTYISKKLYTIKPSVQEVKST